MHVAITLELALKITQGKRICHIFVFKVRFSVSLVYGKRRVMKK